MYYPLVKEPEVPEICVDAHLASQVISRLFNFPRLFLNGKRTHTVPSGTGSEKRTEWRPPPSLEATNNSVTFLRDLSRWCLTNFQSRLLNIFVTEIVYITPLRKLNKGTEKFFIRINQMEFTHPCSLVLVLIQTVFTWLDSQSHSW